jgi:hypothetical protein
MFDPHHNRSSSISCHPVLDRSFVRAVTDDERRARLARRHRLAPGGRVDDVVRITDDLVALHATDASTVHLSAAVRMASPAITAIEAALYDERTVVRMLGMRRTMFVVTDALAPVVQAACTDAIAAVERRRLVQHLEQGGVTDDGARWLRDVAARTLAFFDAHGEALATEVTAAVPALKAQLTFGEGKTWGGTTGVSTRVLSLLAAEGLIVRGRPRGSWTSNQYRWSPMSAWVGDRVHSVPAEDAEVELARRYLHRFGPASRADLKWWTGWTTAKVTRALRALEVVEVAASDGAAVVLPDDVEPVDPPPPWVALLPGLDPTPMGWSSRDWYLGPHRPLIFDRSGNISPTIWCDGRIVGAWAQRRDGAIVHRLFEAVDRRRSRLLAAELERMAAILGDARVTPRFRTPSERELVDG